MNQYRLLFSLHWKWKKRWQLNRKVYRLCFTSDAWILHLVILGAWLEVVHVQDKSGGPGHGRKKNKNKNDLLFITKYTKHPSLVNAISNSRCNVSRSAREKRHRCCSMLYFLKFSISCPTRREVKDSETRTTNAVKRATIQKYPLTHSFFWSSPVRI